MFGGRCVGCGCPGLPVCHRCCADLPGPALACPDPPPPGLVGCWASGEYAGVLGRAVVAHKEEARFAYASFLAERLCVAALAALSTAVSLQGRRVVLVAVPSRPGAARARGDDPMGRLVATTARRLRRVLGSDVAGVSVLPLLRSSRGVQDQAGLDARQRSANLAGSMRCPSPALARLVRVDTRPVVLVCDDVITTGATMREAQRALEAVGVPVEAGAVVAAVRRNHSTLKVRVSRSGFPPSPPDGSSSVTTTV